MKKNKLFNALLVVVTVLSQFMGAMGATPVSAAGGVDIFNNLSSSNDGYFDVGNIYDWNPVGQKFNTDETHTQVTAIGMKVCRREGSTGTYSVELWDAAGDQGLPGQKITDVAVDQDFSTLPLWTGTCEPETYFDSTAYPISLSANTSYYVLVRVNPGASDTLLATATSNPTGTGEFAFFIISLGNWQPGTNYDLRMRVIADSSATSHTVTFNANGGTGSMSDQTASAPTALDLNTFTYTGYSFSGWDTASDGSGTNYADGATYDFSADLTLFAQWSQTPPTVTTQAPKSITSTSATLYGTVNANGNDTNVKFFYHMNSQMPVCLSNHPSVVATPATVSGASNTTISYEFTGLTPETTYYFCAYGLSAGGGQMGSMLSFTTSAIALTAPTVTTQSVTSIQQTTANAEFTITDLGNPHPDSYGVVYSDTNTVPVVSTDTVNDLGLSNGTANSTSPLGISLSGLTPGTTYYLRGFAANSEGTAYGSVVTFTTKPGSFTATAPLDNATSVSTSPTLSWAASENAEDYQYCYGPVSEDPFHCMNQSDPGWISTHGALSASLSGLQPNTEYLWGVRASAGTSITYFTGAPFSFTTAGAASSSTLVVRSTGANDGWVLESAEASNTGGSLNSTNTTFVLGDDGSDREYRAILDFDTSALPDDAIVSSVILKIKRSGSVVGTDPFSFASLYVDMRKPSFGNALLQLTDFNFTANKVKSAVFNPTPVGDWYGAHFNNGGNVYLNRTGATQLRLYFSTGDNNNSITDFIRFFSGEAASGNRPKLIISYTLP